MKKFFETIYVFFHRNKALLFSLFFLLISAFGFLASKLTFESDLNAMFPKDSKQKDISSILTRNKQLDKIILLVSNKSAITDPDLLIAFTDEFARQLKENDRTHLINHVETRQDDEKLVDIIHAIQNNLPFLLDEKDYREIDSLIAPQNIKQILDHNYQTLATPGGLALKQIIATDPIGISYIALKKLQEIQQDENTLIYDGYLFDKSQNKLSFFIHSAYPSSNTKQNEGLGLLIHSTAQKLLQTDEYKNLEFHCFGAQLVAAGNATQMRSDTRLTLSITVILLLLLFIVFFRSFTAPLQIMIPVAFGGLFGMAMMYLLREKVSMISMGASSVILGIAVNYSLHFLSHLRHSKNKRETIRELSIPMTIGSFTTIFAFLSLSLLHTPVLQELGLFTAFNLIGSSICTLIFLPHFIKNPIQQKIENNHQQPFKKGNTFSFSLPHVNWLDKLSHSSPDSNKSIVLGITFITIVLFSFSNKVRFNEDMMKMNYMSKELSNSQAIINQQNSAALNSVFFVIEGKNMNEVLRKNEDVNPYLMQLKKEGLIRKYTAIGNFMPSDQMQTARLGYWNTYWTSEKKALFLSTLNKEGNNIGFNPKAFEGISNILNRQYVKTDTLFHQTFETLFKDFFNHDQSGYSMMIMIKAAQEKRLQLFDSFKKITQGYPVDRQMITTQFVNFVKEDFYKILFLTSFIVFFTILISYGRIELALISFLPMVVTWICILGLMGLFHIEFNIINIIISTLIFGLGDDYSIFITDGLLEKYKYGKTNIDSIKTSIYLSAITTVIGLGILIFAKHPALRSIAMVSVIGIFSILLVSQTLQPLLFNFLIQRRADKKQQPFTLWSLTKTVFAFSYYVIGCLLLTAAGFLLTRVIPWLVGKNSTISDRLKYLYHDLISRGMRSLLTIMGNIKKKQIDKFHFDAGKPSVMIANHSSFLDLLAIISLHPKILLLTNKWVWRSPVFGLLVRMADYYPVEEGAEFSLEKLKYWVDKGYSIAIFPEGTRSYDGEIKRFHKGAFYIAEHLKLAIQPIVIQGIGYTLSKGDFLVKDGQINMKFLPRIEWNDMLYGTGYAEKSKRVRQYMKQEYALLRKEKEHVYYFKEQLIKNYIYKGPVLEWYCRIKVKSESYYEMIEKLMPSKGSILDIGCGYGFLDYMLAWTSKDRTIKGIDYDHEKIDIANHNFSKNNQLEFETMDALDIPESEYYDGILLLDVLHYLPAEQQQILLDKIYSRLLPGGIFILRDGITNLKKKFKGTQLSEYFSTRLFKFNKTQEKLNFISMELIEEFASRNGLSIDVIDQTRFTSNVVVVMQKK